MPTLNGIWRPHSWRDWEIELVDAAWDTVDVITDAVGLTADWALYGHGEGSLSVHILSTLAEDLLTEANWYLKLYRDGVHLRDFMLAKTDQGYAQNRYRTDEYVKVQLAPLDMLFKGHICLPETAGNELVTPDLNIDDAFKWIVAHVVGASAYNSAGATSRVISGLAVAADASAHPTSAELDIFHMADLFDALQKYGPTYEVDWRVRLIKGSGQANVPTFETFYPARGLDKTEDNGARMPVILNDASGEIISARRYLPRVGFANVVIAKSAAKELVDAASVAIWGRHEALVDSGADDRMAGDLQAKSQRAGDEVEFAESEMVEVGAETWQVQPGDWVRVGSHQVGIAHHDAFVRSAHFELTQEGDEKVKLTFGEYEKSLADKMKEGGGSGGGEPWEEGGGVCLWQQVDPGGGGAIYLTQATPGRELRIKNAAAADLFYVDAAGNIGGLASGPGYKRLDFQWYDFGTAQANGLHTIHMSGDIHSYGTGSRIAWTQPGDQIFSRGFITTNNVSPEAGATGFYVDENGNTTWKAAAQMNWEGVPYRMPTTAPAAGQSLTYVSGTTPYALAWAAPAPAAHALVGALHTASGLTIGHVLTATGATTFAFGALPAHAHAHIDLTGVSADQHHAQAHVLVGSDHTAGGLTAGHVLTALSTTTFGFAAPAVHHAAVTVVDTDRIDLTLTGQQITADLKTSGVVAATYGSATQVAQVAVDTYGRVTSASNVTITGVTPAAHDIVGALHTVTGSQYQVVGLTTANTLGLLTPTVVSAANSLVRTDAAGYIRATRLEIGGDTYYIDKASASILRINVANTLDLRIGDVTQLRLQSGVLFAIVTDTVALGTTTYRWSNVFSVEGGFSGDVTVNTAGKGLVMSANTQYMVPMANGTRFVPSAIPKQALPTHAHTYDKATSTGSWTVGTVISYSSNPVRKTDGTQLFYDAGGHVTTTAGTAMAIGSSHHWHAAADYAWTYASTNSGTTII